MYLRPRNSSCAHQDYLCMCSMSCTSLGIQIRPSEESLLALAETQLTWEVINSKCLWTCLWESEEVLLGFEVTERSMSDSGLKWWRRGLVEHFWKTRKFRLEYAIMKESVVHLSTKILPLWGELKSSFLTQPVRTDMVPVALGYGKPHITWT